MLLAALVTAQLTASRSSAQSFEELYRTDPAAALQQLEALPVLTAALHKAAARAAIGAAWLTGEPRSIPFYERASRHARAALALDSLDADAHFWLAAAVGRRAQVTNEGVRATAARGDTAYRAASRALALDSLHAGAHLVLGQLHFEVQKLPGLFRFVGFRLLGLGPDMKASLREACEHLKTAARLAPDEVIAQVELGRCYLKRGDSASALRHLQRALDLPLRHPQDNQLKRTASELAGEINAKAIPPERR